jgi:hypothetical protein
MTVRGHTNLSLSASVKHERLLIGLQTLPKILLIYVLCVGQVGCGMALIVKLRCPRDDCHVYSLHSALSGDLERKPL